MYDMISLHHVTMLYPHMECIQRHSQHPTFRGSCDWVIHGTSSQSERGVLNFRNRKLGDTLWHWVFHVSQHVGKKMGIRPTMMWIQWWWLGIKTYRSGYIARIWCNEIYSHLPSVSDDETQGLIDGGYSGDKCGYKPTNFDIKWHFSVVIMVISLWYHCEMIHLIHLIHDFGASQI